jgi:hypothetical protein
MDLFLKIVGGFALCVIAMLGAAFLYLRWKIRSGLKDLGNIVPTPASIHLTPVPQPAWLEAESVARDLQEFVALGFTKGEVYSIDEIPGVEILALHHEKTGSFGCYYQHPVVGYFVDLCANLSDGLELTVGNAPQGAEMETRPDTLKIFHPGASIGEVFARFTSELAGKTVIPSDPLAFKAEFESAYLRDMAWRESKGGTSEEEFARVASKQDQPVSDEVLRAAFRATKCQEIRTWGAEALEAFRKSTNLSVAQWTEFEDRMCIFRDGFHPQAYLDYLNDFLFLDEEETSIHESSLEGGISLQALLNRITAKSGHKFTKLGELQTPHPTVIYGITLAPDPAEMAA